MTRLAIVGDGFLDIDAHGTASRLCPEAPAPVVDLESRMMRPGGAGLAAVIAARAGAPVRLVMPLVEDAAGTRLRHALEAEGVEVVPLPATGSTAVKQRILASGTVVARIDRGRTVLEQDARAAARIEDAVADADAILVSDYGRGTTAERSVRQALIARAASTPLVWDPHPRGAAPVPGTRIVTPSEHEARVWAERLGRREPTGTRRMAFELARAIEDARVLAARWSIGIVALTLGARGVLVQVGDGAPLVIPPDRRATGDPCGAGDAFAGALALAAATGTVASEAAAVASRAALGFLEAGGTAGLDRTRPAATRDEAQARIAAVRSRGGRIVATGGCFDLLHAGHVETLTAARALGDCLVVLLNSDASVRALKGNGRPLQRAADRRRVLEALAAVDAVILFEEPDPAPALRALRPHVWVKGGDYTGTILAEESVVTEWGGATVTVPYLAGHSTTSLAMQLDRQQRDEERAQG